MFKFPESRILVFAKPPIPGTVKTRLQSHLSAQQCATLQQHLIHYALETCCNTQLCPIELWCANNTDHPYFIDCQQRFPISLHLQQGEDLGKRMLHALQSTLSVAKNVIIIGTDCIELQHEHLEQALTTLSKTSMVIIPATDGGYVLIGGNEANPTVFHNIDWGQASVLEQTQQQLRTARIQWQEMAPLADIDYPNDLANAQQQHPELSWLQNDALCP